MSIHSLKNNKLSSVEYVEIYEKHIYIEALL